MQQGLRPYVQDENAMAALHRPPALHLKGGASASDGNGSTFAGKSASGLPFVRKALGNITNSKAGFGGGGAEAMVPGKTQAGTPAARRALGDITNSKAAAPSAQKTAQKAAPLTVKPAPSALQQQQQHQFAAVAAAPHRADVLAEGGVERMAGHSWEQLEEHRLAREDAEIQQRLAALANFPALALPTFFPFWGAPTDMAQQQMLQKDVLPMPAASPVAKQPPAGGASNDLTDLDLPLPDIALPDIGESMELELDDF